MTQGRRLPLRDRAWLEVETIRVIGPLMSVTAPALRQTLVAVHADHPGHRVVCRLDRAGGRWLPIGRRDIEAYCDETVLETTTGGPDAGHAIMRKLLAHPLGDHPLVFAVGGGYVGIKISHAFGDARILGAWQPELVRAAAAGTRAQLPGPDSSTRLPLLRGALLQFARSPGRIGRAFRVGRRPAPPPSASAPAPWRPDPVHRYTRVTPAALTRLRQWRDAEAPGVSVTTILLAAIPVALTRCGVGAQPDGLVMLIDARRYLPPGSVIDGNFCWGQYLHPTDPTDPRAVQDTLKEEIASGRPLGMLILRQASLLLGRGGHSTVPTTVPTEVRPELTVSSSGRLETYEDLPWAAGPDGRESITVATPAGPPAITVSVDELSGTLHLTAVFHGSTFDAEAVRRAMDLVGADPVGLVSSAGGQPVAG
ncbi:MAG TPA: hypothetical protein VK453_05995 [Micromonosporaceae bacterium]|nr:hypothetical protein [Micromonosporaceae bacterium]